MRLAYHYYYPFLYLPTSQSTTTACWRPNPNRLPTCSAFGRSDGQHAHVLTHEKHVEIPGTLSSSKANIEFYGYLWNSMDIMKFYGYLWNSMDIYGYYVHIQTHSIQTRTSTYPLSLRQSLTGAFTTTKFNLVFGSDMCLLGIIRPNEY